MSLRTAAQQALEALESCWEKGLTRKNWKQAEEAITALRTALAEPEQEFVCSTGLCRYRKPLTDEEMKRVCAETFSYDPYVIARAIERAHGIGGEA